MNDRSESPGFRRELKEFLLYHKRWWVTPILLVMLLILAVALIGSGGESGFVYDLF